MPNFVAVIANISEEADRDRKRLEYQERYPLAAIVDVFGYGERTRGLRKKIGAVACRPDLVVVEGLDEIKEKAEKYRLLVKRIEIASGCVAQDGHTIYV